MGQNEDCSPGDRTSDTSKEWFKKGSGEGQYIRCFEGEFRAVKYLLYKGFLLVKESDVTMNGFSAFLDVRRCLDWDHETSF